ncbi:MAG: alpha/beta hydrolase [Chitinophagaceae bacterium]|jgi:alpha-beta hydrolase superfamily lysophospholipase|nr:alpha/beta hydrolase [Chitinophagaceae bacterium]MBK9660818.1 alpha/beta hydrolase [Chitinophagaceae bacterium]MBK9939942.1 alpha/beta hydrolase [Chitinophagaceae bacterium]MBL0068933.1 alpha/beta hydrolase [Chitinophagaceae bacterium]MBP6417311.1 alpha/beta hydrolase [Chitinophagaceae bacterium]
MKKGKPRLQLPSYVRWILWVLLVQIILINISAAFYAHKLTHVYTDRALRSARPSKNIFVKTWRLFTGPRQAKSIITETPTFPFDTVVLKTAKGITIDAWYSKPDSQSRGTVILFHGITANKGMIVNEAHEFRSQGYNVMLVDYRAHGNSEGQTTTIGVRESEEVKLAYAYIAGKGENNIFLWGSSMGAVVVAKAIAEYNLKPAGAMLEMPFASLQSHLQARARALGFQGIPEKPFSFFVTWWMGIERGFNGFRHTTSTYVEKVNCPVLMQWGAMDNYVRKYETEKVYNAIAAANKKLVVYDRAGHESLLQNDPAKWRIEVDRFLMANTK